MDGELREFERLLNNMTGSDDPIDKEAGHAYFVLKEKMELLEAALQQIAKISPHRVIAAGVTQYPAAFEKAQQIAVDALAKNAEIH